MNSVVLPYASLSHEDPIVTIVFNEDVDLGFVEIRELIYNSEKLSGKKEYFTLSKIPANVRVSPMGKEIASDINEAPLHKGSAVVVKNKFYELAVNFFQSVNPPRYPFKAFTDEDEAREWLLGVAHRGGERVR